MEHNNGGWKEDDFPFQRGDLKRFHVYFRWNSLSSCYFCFNELVSLKQETWGGSI